MGEVKARAAAIALALVALAGCAHAPALPAGARYVGLGSSFAAGAGIGPTRPGTPARCQRTEINYAGLLAARLGLSLDDQSCGGATTAHILNGWNELPPQVAALTADTRLVTVTIGGNDLNYVGNLFMAGCDPAKGFTVQGHTRPCAPPRAPADADYARAEAGLRAVAAEVKARSPQARLVFVQYVRLVPDAPCPAANISGDNAVLTRTIGERLAEVTARVARESGALVLPMDELSRGHGPCDAEPWAIGLPPGHDPSKGAPWHPTARGHAAIAAALADLLD
jgi:lysophospholipase L1-like esterase